MSLSDDWHKLISALTGRPDTAEEARLLALFNNRAELKKELNALDDERQRLLDRLKLQEGSTVRVEEQLAGLEQYLGRPEEGNKCLAYFQLRSVWRSASHRLEQFATELARQQKDRERRQQLADFERSKRNRLDEVDREVYDARILADQLAGEQAAERQRQDELRGFWNYFRRRRLGESTGERQTRIDEVQTALTDLGDRRHAIDSEAPPAFAGISVEGRRAVNLAIIAFAEALCERLAPSNLAWLARQSTLSRVYDADYGGDAKCAALIQSTTRAIRELDAMQEDLPDIKRRTDRLKSRAAWRGPGDTIPLQESVGPTDTGSAAAARGAINVLLDEYFDVRKLMLD
jgi:hypothetical protein